jgi:hypothetical protein
MVIVTGASRRPVEAERRGEAQSEDSSQLFVTVDDPKPIIDKPTLRFHDLERAGERQAEA